MMSHTDLLLIKQWRSRYPSNLDSILWWSSLILVLWCTLGRIVVELVSNKVFEVECIVTLDKIIYWALSARKFRSTFLYMISRDVGLNQFHGGLLVSIAIVGFHQVLMLSIKTLMGCYASWHWRNYLRQGLLLGIIARCLFRWGLADGNFYGGVWIYIRWLLKLLLLREILFQWVRQWAS